MGLVRIDAGPQGLTWHDTGQPALPGLARTARGTGPVVIMIHGFTFAPGDPRHCPHRHILSDHDRHPCWKAASWPRALGLTGDGALGIAFGWQARGTIWQAYTEAGRAGLALARLIAELRRVAPERPVRLIAHSLGARVALSALPHLARGAVDRTLLLTPAERLDLASAALASEAGRSAGVVTVASSENRLYEQLLRAALPATPVVTAEGIPGGRTLRIDDDVTLGALARLGHPVAPRSRRSCHWSSYLRPGLFDLYRALLSAETPLPLAALGPVGTPETDPQPLHIWPAPGRAIPSAAHAS
ncbi:alpha/beta hydrolase [Oceanicola sp. 22II-s10i]|uniref:alpha/beta hydrolase n=1 Tax=Oceanicola sp. 22II-s10i TaxID=1317116 RepID=UPI000B52248F|nr:alpha/beta hydrolase [Oceanicola sp. 22II-s10i]